VSNRQYSVQPTMFVNPHSHAQTPVHTPDAKLVEALHLKYLDMIPGESLALAINHIVGMLLRVHVRPDGMFEPELLYPHPTKKGGEI